MSQFCQCGWDETRLGPWRVPWKAWEAAPSPRASSLGEGESFLAGEFPLGAEQCWLGEWGDAGEIGLFYSL